MKEKIDATGTGGPAKRSSTNTKKFPENQRASEVQRLLEGLSLAAVAHELCPLMTYPGWKSVRGSFGRAALKERMRRHGLPADHPQYVSTPLLWTYAECSVEEGGIRYLYLKRDKGLLEDVWKKERRNGSLHLQALKKSEELPMEPWPRHICEVEGPTADVVEASDEE